MRNTQILLSYNRDLVLQPWRRKKNYITNRILIFARIRNLLSAHWNFRETTWCQISICQYFTAAGAVWWFHRQLRCCQAQVPVLWWKGHHVIVWNKQVRCSIYLYCMSVNVLVSLVAPAKGQLISKANSKLFIWTKNQRKYFCISALASKNP